MVLEVAVQPEPARVEPPPLEPTIGAEDVVRAYAVSKATAYVILNSLPHLRLGRCIRVPRSIFDAWIAAQLQAGEGAENG